MPYFVAMGTRGERLKKARMDAGYPTAKNAADALGIRYSTYAGHENGTRDYGVEDAAVYARKFKVTTDWLLYGRTGTTLTKSTIPLATIPVIGIVRAGLWQEADEGDSGLYEAVPAAPDAPAEWQYAFTVEGTSLNKIAIPGDFLICLDAVKSGYAINENDLVIVERSRFDGQMLERTAKRIRRAAGGIWELWPESTDPAYQQPIILKDTENGDEVRVVAKVLWIMHKP